MGDSRRVVGRVPELLGKEWGEVAPELKEFITKLAQIISDPSDSEADVGTAVAWFMAATFSGASGAWGGAGAPLTSEYLTGAADGTLVNERVVTNTTSISWDLATPGQAKASVLPPTVGTPAQITSNQNDYNDGATDTVRLSTDASRDITGVVAASGGIRRLWVNVGAFNVVLKHQNAGSTAVNRLLCSGGVDVTLLPNQACLGFYDATTQRWRVYTAI